MNEQGSQDVYSLPPKEEEVKKNAGSNYTDGDKQNKNSQLIPTQRQTKTSRIKIFLPMKTRTTVGLGVK